MKTTHFCPVRWALIFFVPMAVVICLSAAYNYFIDPLWQWPHSHHLERWHRGFNERLLKTNYLASRDVNIDTLILGSSVSSYFRPSWLGTENGFSYISNGGQPREFAERIEYAKKRSGMPIRLIFVEAWNAYMFDREWNFEEPSYYIENAESAVKKIRNLFSLSTLGYSLQARKTPKHGYYFVDRFGQPSECRYPLSQFDDADKKRQETDAYLAGKKGLYSAPYDAAYPQYFADIHRAAGDAEVIVYSPPVVWQDMKLFAEMGHLDMFEQRLRELVSEFGRVYQFFYPNPIAMDNANFNDTHHPTGEAAELIMGIIMRLRSGEITEDTEHGGILLTNENIEEWLPVFREKMEGVVALSS